MADTKKQPAKEAKLVLPDTEKELNEMIAELRSRNIEQVRSIKSGTATNVRAGSKTKKDIARALTKLNQVKKEGERS